MRDHGAIVARMKLRTDFVSNGFRARRITVGTRHETHAGMMRRNVRAQLTHAARPDDGDANFFFTHINLFAEGVRPQRRIIGHCQVGADSDGIPL
jgi:hypothetical protein